MSRPSAHNLRKLARYFGLDDAELDAPHSEFATRLFSPTNNMSDLQVNPLQAAFPGSLKNLRGFTGSYRVFYTSPAVPQKIISAAVFLHERDGRVYTRSIERLPVEGQRGHQRSRCNGEACFHGGRLFVVDFEPGNGGALSMTSLVPPHRYRQGLIFGMTFFLASFPRRTPHASRVAWQKVELRYAAKEILQGCGIFPMTALNIHPAVRSYLQEPTPQMTMDPAFSPDR